MRQHKKSEKAMAPLMFPIREKERRKKYGLDFPEVATPKSSLTLTASNMMASQQI